MDNLKLLYIIPNYYKIFLYYGLDAWRVELFSLYIECIVLATMLIISVLQVIKGVQKAISF